MLDDTVSGRGAGLEIRAEAGLGKSALLDVVRREVTRRGLTLLSADGVEHELELAYAALHQALHPLLDRVSGLPAPQRRALRCAFGQEDGTADVYTVALAALELVVEAAADHPVVILLEDMHWVDTPSIDALAFMARRIASEPVLMLATTRTGARFDPRRRPHLPELDLRPLSTTDAEALLDGVAPALTTPVRTRVLAEAAGNPLALKELPRALNGATAALGAAVPLNTRLKAAFAARLDHFAPSTRALLITLAADVTCDTQRLLAAATAVHGAEVTPQDLQEAIDDGLTEIAGPGLRFRHPLMRSAVYAHASLSERIDAHTALAAQLAAFPDRQLWHRASAVLGTSESLAAELERYALRCERRGTVMAAVAALRKAADLTEAEDRRTSLVLHAAELTGEIGARHEAAGLLERADVSALGPVDSARLTSILEVIDFSRYDDAEARVRELTAAAARLHTSGHVEPALTLLWRAAKRCFFQQAGAHARTGIVDGLRALGLPEDDPRALAVRAYADPDHHSRAVLRTLSRLTPDWTNADTMRLLGTTSLVLGDFRRSAVYMDTAAEICRRQGRLGQLPQILVSGGWERIWLGEWDKAYAESEEAGSLARETGEEFYTLSAQANIAALAALRGDIARARETAARVMGHPLAASMRYLLLGAQQSDALAVLLDGEADQAYRMLERLYDPAQAAHHPVMQWWAAPDLVDAAVAADRVEQARHLLKPLPELADRSASPVLQMAAHYVAAVLADGPQAEALYQAALSGPVGSWPLYRARLQLHLGRRLRRRRRAQDSRDPLRAARDTFDLLGAAPWAEAARGELRAAGESSARREHGIHDELTAQELQIATLAAGGLTNRQIAERLFLSHRTVGSHLYRIFPKLGVATRAQLATALHAGRRD